MKVQTLGTVTSVEDLEKFVGGAEHLLAAYGRWSLSNNQLVSRSQTLSASGRVWLPEPSRLFVAILHAEGGRAAEGRGGGGGGGGGGPGPVGPVLDTLHATADCTDDASIVGLDPLNWAIV